VQGKPSQTLQNLALEVTKMYRKKDNQLTIDDFILPFNGALLADNRWVSLLHNRSTGICRIAFPVVAE